MTTAQIIYVKNDMLIELIGLQDVISLVFQNTGTVVANIHDKDDTLIIGPISMAYVAASDGDYRGTIEDSAAFISGKLYTAKVSADASGGLKGYWELPLRAETRKFS